MYEELFLRKLVDENFIMIINYHTIRLPILILVENSLIKLIIFQIMS